jgi:DNA-binding LytR/AlgR family response regulator
MPEMRKINVLVVDDDTVAREEARRAIAFYVEKDRIRTASNVEEMMRALNEGPVDLAFLDMEMPDTDGFSVADYLMKSQPHTKYVFLTGHTELGAKSYEYEPLDFLCKPVNVMRLQKTFERFDRIKHGSAGEQIAVETASGFVLIAPEDIRYISRDSRKTVIHCGEKEYIASGTLAELELIFGDYGLFRCHQSFLLSLKHVVRAEKSGFGRTFSAVLDTGEEIPVSRHQFAGLREQLERRGTKFI